MYRQNFWKKNSIFVVPKQYQEQKTKTMEKIPNIDDEKKNHVKTIEFFPFCFNYLQSVL